MLARTVRSVEGLLHLERKDFVQLGGIERLLYRIEPDILHRHSFILLILRQKSGGLRGQQAEQTKTAAEPGSAPPS